MLSMSCKTNPLPTELTEDTNLNIDKALQLLRTLVSYEVAEDKFT